MKTANILVYGYIAVYGYALIAKIPVYFLFNSCAKLLYFYFWIWILGPTRYIAHAQNSLHNQLTME